MEAALRPRYGFQNREFAQICAEREAERDGRPETELERCGIIAENEGMGNGKWENGEWVMGNGKWGMRNGNDAAVPLRTTGFPSPAEGVATPALDLNALLVKRPAATFFMRMEGDSMAGAGMFAGDILVVDRSLAPADGDIIVAAVDGEFVARVFRRGKGGARLETAPGAGAAGVIRIGNGGALDYFGKVTASIHMPCARKVMV